LEDCTVRVETRRLNTESDAGKGVERPPSRFSDLLAGRYSRHLLEQSHSHLVPNVSERLDRRQGKGRQVQEGLQRGNGRVTPHATQFPRCRRNRRDVLADGCDELIADWSAHRDGGGEGTLVLAGNVALPIPERDDIRVLGRVSDTAKADLLDAADVLVLPSRFESLGIVLLEAWQAGTPVLVPAWNAVTAGQVRRGGARGRCGFVLQGAHSIVAPAHCQSATPVDTLGRHA